MKIWLHVLIMFVRFLEEKPHFLWICKLVSQLPYLHHYGLLLLTTPVTSDIVYILNLMFMVIKHSLVSTCLPVIAPPSAIPVTKINSSSNIYNQTIMWQVHKRNFAICIPKLWEYQFGLTVTGSVYYIVLKIT